MLFRRTNRYGYSRYYGNTGNILRIVKIILFFAVVLAVAAGLVIWGMQKYVFYDADGAHLVLPWQSSEADSPEGGDGNGAQSPGSGSPSLTLPEVIVDDGSAASSGVTPEGDGSASGSSVTPEGDGSAGGVVPEPVELEQLLAQHLNKSQLKSASAARTLKKANANAALAYLKESSGALNFCTENELAVSLGVSARAASDGSDATLNAIAGLQEEGYKVVAYVDCFRDKALGAKTAYAILTSSGSRWKDGNGTRWASPSNEAVQDYLCALVQELAAAGVDEIVLNHAAYPTSGNVDKIAEENDKTEVVTAFYQKLAAAVAGSDTILSVYSDETTITTGANAVSGQTLEAIKLLGGRVWVSGAADPEALQTALEEAGIDGSALCLLTSALDTESAFSQCVLN